MQFARGLAWIVGLALIGVAALVFFGLQGTEREKAPPGFLGTRGAEGVGPSSPAGADSRGSRLAAAREKDRRAAGGRLNREADAPSGEAVSYQEGSARVAADPLGTGNSAVAGARAPRPGTGASGTHAGQGTDRPESQADRARIDAFLRVWEAAAEEEIRAWEAAAEEAFPERDYGRDDRILDEVSVGDPDLINCGVTQHLCNYVSSAVNEPGAIAVISDGAEAVFIPRPAFSGSAPNVVYIRAGDAVIVVRTDNLTNADQLDALVARLVPGP